MNISGGTSARTGCLSETSEDCSGQRRLHQSSRPATLDAARFYKQSDWGGKNTRSSYADIPHLQTMDANKRQLGDKTEGYGNSRKTGFSGGSSSDRLTEEQENEIAENIYDWWISGKSYKQWYVEKFQQLKLDFGEF